jgi:hypothetical protein
MSTAAGLSADGPPSAPAADPAAGPDAATFFAFILMGNHLHIGLIVSNPELIPLFMKYIKCESAGAINRLLGRSAKNIWEEGYDSPVILDAQKCMEKIAYIYLNPAEANLVDSIDHYPGFSSWRAFTQNETKKSCPWIRRKRISILPYRKPSSLEQAKLKDSLLESSKVSLPFTVEPNAWMGCFKELQGRDPEEINREILSLIRSGEAKLRSERTKPVMGEKKLISEVINKPYLPRTRGQRSWCLGSDITVRREFINWLKGLFAKGRAVYESWKQGDYLASYPPGLFPPAGIYRGNILPLGLL